MSLSALSISSNACKNAFQTTFTNEFLKKNYSKKFNQKILRTGDIRGFFLKDFNFGFVDIFAENFSQYLKETTGRVSPHILVGHDARAPSSYLSELLIERLLEQGITVDKLGLIPTPLAYFLMEHYNRTAAVILTASHNPKEYAGFKYVLNSKYKVFNVAPEVNSLILKNKNQTKAQDFENTINTKAAYINADKAYIKSLKEEFKNLNFSNFVLDGSNGSAGLLAKKVFSAFNLDPHYINIKPDGTFPNHSPDPTKASSLVQLKKKLAKTKGKFGFLFDGDGDRLIVITSDGEKLDADQYMYLFLEDLKLLKKPRYIVVDTKTSNWFINKAKLNFKISETKTGYYYLKQKMHKLNSIIAFEDSGHIIFNDRPNRGHDDAIYNVLRFIELVDQRGIDYINKKLKEVEKFKKRNFVLLNVDRHKEESLLMDKLKKYLDLKGESYSYLDGIKISRGDSWATFRFSNTEDHARITVQSDNEKESLDMIEEISGILGKSFKEQ